jgi:hypothetical protein
LLRFDAEGVDGPVDLHGGEGGLRRDVIGLVFGRLHSRVEAVGEIRSHALSEWTISTGTLAVSVYTPALVVDLIAEEDGLGVGS